MTGMAGMAERQKEWQMALNGGMVEWQRWRNGRRNGGMAAERRNGSRMAGLLNGGRMAGWSNGGMVEWQEWWNGQMARMAGLLNGGMVEWRRATRMAGMSTYLLFYGTRRRRHRR